MGEMILAFLNSTTTVYVLWALCLLSFLFFVGYAVSREGRDEHGRAILGSACFYGAIALFIAMNYFYPGLPTPSPATSSSLPIPSGWCSSPSFCWWTSWC